MPNMKNAIKKDRQIAKKTVLNNHYDATMKNSIKRAEKAISSNDKEKATGLLKTAITNLDKALSKGIIHKNKVAREKSRLAKKTNEMK